MVVVRRVLQEETGVNILRFVSKKVRSLPLVECSREGQKKVREVS